MAQKRTKSIDTVPDNVLLESRTVLKKKMKIEMLKYCLLWGYSEKQTIQYFKDRDVELSHTNLYELKKEFRSRENIEGWFNEVALSVMESVHRESIEQTSELIKVVMVEIQQLQSSPVYINEGTPTDPKLKLNEEHDTMALSRMIETFNNLVKNRDDMLAATPVVQAIINEQARKQEKSMVTN